MHRAKYVLCIKLSLYMLLKRKYTVGHWKNVEKPKQTNKQCDKIIIYLLVIK